MVASLSAQDLGAYLPSSVAEKTSRLLATIRADSSAIEAKRRSAREAQLASEATAMQSFALISASRGGQGNWAAPDGSARASEAVASFSAARGRARAAAALLFSGGEEIDGLVSARSEAAASLAKLLRGSGLGFKSALGLVGYLDRDQGEAQRLFPETIEIESILKKAGTRGAREAASLAAWDWGEGRAASLLDSKEEILKLAPSAEGALIRLEIAYRAYCAWIAASLPAAYSGEFASLSEPWKAALPTGIQAMAGLRSSRASSLIEAMASGDDRDQAAAEAARRLSQAWERSSAAKRRSLADLFGLPESMLASCFSAIAPYQAQRPLILSHGGRAIASTVDLLSAAYSLGGLSSAMAGGGSPESSVHGAEPALLLFERPDLAKVARSELRYEKLYAEASRRLGALCAEADSETCSMLETSTQLIRSATLALGKTPKRILVSAVDLESPADDPERRVAFVATASDPAGASIFLPLPSILAADAYASAFAKAAGLDISETSPESFLSHYGQRIVTAYDPEGSRDGLVFEAFPREGGPHRFNAVDLEFALLGGWIP
jgi:hypothetical protein